MLTENTSLKARTVLTPENLSLILNLDLLILYILDNCSVKNTYCASVLSSSLIEICQFSYPVYYAFLKYLYTDEVDELSIDSVMSKFMISNFFIATAPVY